MRALKNLAFVLLLFLVSGTLAAFWPNRQTVVTTEVTIAGNKKEIYEILADFAHADRWAEPIHKIETLTPNSKGVGAIRQCHLEGGIIVQEKILEAEQDKRIAIEMIEHELPVDYIKWNIEVEDGPNSKTRVRQTTKYKVKYGLFGKFLFDEPIADNLRDTLAGVYQNLKDHVESRP